MPKASSLALRSHARLFFLFWGDGAGGASERTQEVNQQLRVLEYSTPRKVHWPREVKKILFQHLPKGSRVMQMHLGA